MSSIYLIFLCLLIGFLLKKFNFVDANGFRVLNILIIYIALPALTLHFIPEIVIHSELFFPIAMPWINILLSWLFFGYIGKKFHWGKSLTGAMIIMSGFGNTSFVGIPVIQALYGAEGIETVIMVDQPGSFVALTTLGILIASIYSNQNEVTASSLFKNILKFPPFIAFLIGFTLNILGISLPKDIDATLEMLSKLVVPLALISVGMQVELDFKSSYWRYVGISLGFKLLVFPAIIFGLYFLILRQRGEAIEITLLESGMGPMITAGIIATGYDLEARFCSLVLSVGLLLSLFTIPLWYWFVHF